MKLASYLLADGSPSYGIVNDAGIADAGAALRGKYSTLRAVLAADALAELTEAASSASPLDPATVRYLSPITDPDKIICIGLNYMGHIIETGKEKPSYPSIFTRYPSSIVGQNEALICPKVSSWFDYEGELAVVIGKAGRSISEQDAFKHVAGYCCFNDGSIRDYQRHTTQFWAGKNFDRSGSMGPYLVTADEVGDPDALTLITRLNGEEVQSTSTGDLAFKIPEIIAYLSIVTELLPGDVIATGTPSGVGLFREPKLFMKDGDTVEVEITGLGTLRNPVRAEA
ncbi:5-carboxymethyl-2-hydroxymuconate isomerase [Nitratireductor aestuarii]|uniref:5-carboxymethyl-2-hydroxymuconate isomerase n=1 Tax=Nitratireductor aestuarii TaxID=1735103 RepID=A0A916W8P5_9HYPH|nr:fumarylacetoacetate hydrolase family protein [Nitratireductor aestuarii]GGA77172.1 5-carboxymethyl-2-hydroxymuconate isomerase [Nitratireductor aestuarii]